ncbi:uncharacterized protein BJ171DRAFT_495015 [Polychytrium aggregatum]|uniref:uncharacterized protein n=1 Tax=Polychytrium aggregatum TaxID=110093 RepID=UPI0022FE9368|nr:uncharacterized protein BJ171DRAFT_495015 [Polychytrium aggregatum]KAI9206863.1 hypothetical protein BJ171DRAFT_495015 [Polychytrium aggregatum]
MIHESLQTLRHSTPPPPPPPRSESRTPIFWEFNPRDHTGDGAAGGWDAPHESRLDLGATTKSWPTRDAGGDSQDRDAAPVQANFEDMSDAIIMRKLHPVLEKAQSEFQKAARRMEETLDRLDRQHGSKGGLERGESKDSLDRLLGESVIKVETYHEPTLESSKPKPSKPAAVHLPLKTGNDFLADVDNVDSDNFVLKYILTKLQSIEDEGKELRKHIAVAHSGRESPSHAAKSDDARCSSSPPQLPIASSAPAASAADTQSSPSMHPENPIKSCDSGSRAPEPHFREPSDEIVIEKHSRNPAPRIPVADDFTKLARRYNARAQIELPPELVQRIEQGRSKYQRYLNNSMGPASVGYDDDTEWSMTPWKALDRMSAEFLDVVLSDVAAELSKVTDDFVDRMMKEEFSPLQATADRA